MLSKLGLYAVRSSLPILDQMSETGMLGMLLGVLLKFLVLGLFVLSVITLMNVANINVERRSYELGMRRCIGMPRRVLFRDMLIDSLKMVLIANALAYPTALLVLNRTDSLFSRFFSAADRLSPDFQAALIAFTVGMFAPVLSFLLPLRNALSEQIVSAVQPIRNRIVSLKHEVFVEGREVPIGRVLFSVIAWFFGFVIIYLLPRGLMNEDLALLLIIFLGGLIAFQTGLIQLCFSILHSLERLTAKVLMFFRSGL